ncbi:ABC transporter ATP-binding protein [Streptococcus anginosus]|uniref:ATP-binding cassette domain-containing protein n=4 Tax=Bacillota TaxID=1239 RepID=A0AAP9HC54_9BACL|nr:MULTISPECIES: ABC transporter ATP-binding protein [Bacillota]EFV34747.1 ABC transporter [Gemella morbillorum M424]MCY7076947.1 ABC transporter ATP-binding protein/permease [Streptococcus oralis]NWO22850.1 ABC transporter ATP-binding protein [Mogibacterium timidum]QGS08677.1 ATP-binding cassette domain-containing protein [Gemella morbillorum]QGS09133.1 ATP-binding cassette domain-containing protein [Gemella morbillorum]
MEVLKEHKGKVFTSALIAIIGVGLGVVPYFSVANIINNIVEGKVEIGAYIPYILAVLVGLLGSVLFHELSTIISHNLAYRVIEGKRKKLVDKLSKISMGEIEKRSSGQWSQFMVETLDKMEQPIAHVIPEVIANLLIPIVLVVIIFIMDWRIGVANLLTIPLGLLFFMMMMRGYEEKSKRYQEASKAMNTTMVEYVNGIKVIKAFNKSASSFGKFKETVNENKKAMLDWYLSVCFSMTGAMETIPATMIFVLPTSLYLFMQGSVEMSLLIMCILLSYASYKPLIKAMSHLETMANIKIVMKEINKVMEIPDLERGKQLKHIKSYDVEFQNVSFAYDESKNVLNNISFKANEKELTAIVGDSGGGKSTIAKLIAGFWNIDKGKILIGDVDLNDMPLKQNMELITYVSQENFLFNKTILENLRVAKEDASMDEIKEACVKASCHDFIMNLPNGYETVVGEGGSSLSGGERQRIVIARSFLKNSPIVLLDEATAYSDSDNEAIIQESIDALIKDKTVIMIAHRLSTIVKANKIIVVDNGNIVEEGSHEKLLELNGRYREMWDVYTEAKEIEVI